MSFHPSSWLNGRHPLHVALRTYTLSLSLTLFPALLPLLTSRKSRSAKKTFEILKRELSPTSFAFAITLAVCGGKVLDQYLNLPQKSSPDGRGHATDFAKIMRRLSPAQRTFLANTLSSSIAVMLLTSTRRSRHIPMAPVPLTVTPSPRGSPTLDLTLLLFVRALDAGAQILFQRSDMPHTDLQKNDTKQKTKETFFKAPADLDTLVFWLACSRIMWCFFYEPERLPKSYVKWITSLADMDPRLLLALRAIRDGTWRYGRPSLVHGSLMTSMASDLNLNPILGDPKHLPARGGIEANRAWMELGVKGREGIGGIPCNIVHCGVAGNSCTGNAVFRGIKAFGQALLIYSPVHIFPTFFTDPTIIFRDPFPTLYSLFRSASFLSTFVSSIWFTVCFVRTLFVARYFPQISHNILDGPKGCVLAGCIICGASIKLERRKRRAEIALYVLPRAIRACLPDRWIKSGSPSVKGTERLVFIMSLASILTVAIHQPDSLRGLSRWTITYIMSGTNSAFWRKRRRSQLPSNPKQDCVEGGDRLR